MFPFPAPLLCMGTTSAAPAFVPTDLGSKLLAWWDPSDLSTLTATGGGPVSTTGTAVLAMNDKSGNGKNLRQDGSSVRRPTYQVDGSGNAYLLFDGVDDTLQINPWVLGLPFERIYAVNPIAANGWIFLNGTSPNRFSNINSLPVAQFSDNGTNIIQDGVTLGTNVVVTERHIAGASKIAANNDPYVTGNTGSTSTAYLSLGATLTGTSAANFRFYGAIIGDGTLTTTEIANCRTYLGNKCGLTL